MKMFKVILLTLLLGTMVTSEAQGRGKGFFRRGLSAAEKEVLVTALAGPDGEYAAHAGYAAILKKFGEVQPYASIIKAEENHIAALERQFDKYGIAIPTNQFAGSVTAPATLEEAAKAAVAGEERNVAMYNEALKKVSGRPDLVRVFTHLRDASQNAHAPAFKTALANGGKVEKAAGACCGMPCCKEDSCCMGDRPLQRRQRGPN